MSESPSVSVVVPFHDSARHIEACLEALLGQTAASGSYDLIFIDNGSTDASAAIVARHPRVALLNESAPGAYAARNTGIEAAQYPILAFTDADCVVASDWIHSIQRGMQDPRTAIMVGSCRYPRRATLPLRLLCAYENAKTEYVVERCSPDQQFAYANNMAVRRSVFEDLGGFETWDRAADTELVHRVAKHRPDLALVYNAEMKITHREFLDARARARRLSLYARTNAKIPTFRELRAAQHLAVLWRLLRPRTAS